MAVNKRLPMNGRLYGGTFNRCQPYLLERGEGFFRVKSFPHFGKQQIKGIKTSANNIQADADRCKQTQTVSLVHVTQALDNNISPPKLIWSAQPRCWPRPID